MFEIVNAVGDFVREMETVCNRMLEAPIIKHSMAVENCMFIAYITDTLLKRFKAVLDGLKVHSIGCGF